MGFLYLEHSGTPHDGLTPHSGRYPWGSGENAYQHSVSFMGNYKKLRDSGMTDKEIADYFDMSTTELRSRKSISSGQIKAANRAKAIDLHERGWSNMAISEKLGVSDKTIGNYLREADQAKQDKNQVVMDILKDQVDKKEFLDVGAGVEFQLGVSETRMKNALKELERQGYKIHNVYVPNATDPSKRPATKVLCKDDVDYQYMVDHKDKILSVDGVYVSPEGIRKDVQPFVSVDSKRVKVRYAEDGGIDKDGVIELRPGVKDIALGSNSYAQVRIAVDGTHYLKGMAVYSNDLPKGCDIMFNTNKDKSVPMMGEDKNNTVLKLIKTDKDLPFGSVVRQTTYDGADGQKHQSAINIVNEEADWNKWAKTLSSQMVSKQPDVFAKKVLNDTYKDKKQQFDEICSLTNEAVKKKLLNEFADGLDSDAVHLKAKGLPGQKTHVILPVVSMKENEVFAPNYQNGEEVVLVRYPHAGRFEMPKLTVNNKNKEAREVIGTDASCAIGINPRVAERLSGADFDGDTVTVIPLRNNKIKNAEPLKGLKDFDPKIKYKAYEGMPEVGSKENKFDTQKEMGIISNLITDMTLQGADSSELERAVRHSMVVIDAEKHNLNFKQSYVDNGIAQLKKEYQTGGASTLISRAKRDARIPEYEEVVGTYKMTDEEKKDYYEGKKIYRQTGRTYVDKKTGKTIAAQTKTNEMTAAFVNGKDAYSLSSGTTMENIYADHANKLVALANEARKEMIATPNVKYVPSAAKAYKEQVETLNGKLNIAKKNAPAERQAQRVASVIVDTKLKENPALAEDNSQLKKIRAQAIEVARNRVNPDASRTRIVITDKEWEAIQAGAISHSKLTDILKYTKDDEVKKRATPVTKNGLSSAQIARAKTLLSQGYTWNEVSESIGISASSLQKALAS